jgi:hypothetical protein
MRHQPTPERRKLVEESAGHGMPHATIASIIGISVSTLTKYYVDELATGSDKATANVAKRLYLQATSDKDSQPNTIARIFWLKARGKWRDQVVEHLGADGLPLPPPVQILLPDNNREPVLRRQYYPTALERAADLALPGPMSDAERQRRYRDRKKLAQLAAPTSE